MPGRLSRITPLRSLYDEFLATSPDNSVETIKTRTPQLDGRKGGNEPKFTSYTHFWKNTLGQLSVS
jgi:RNA exonuclease NGL2